MPASWLPHGRCATPGAVIQVTAPPAGWPQFRSVHPKTERIVMPEQPQWGRIWSTARPDGEPSIRQGAWYPILSHGATRVVLDVGGHPVDLPVRLVETRPKPPDRFTVVYRATAAANPVSGTRQDLGKVYAVCPRDATRIRLYGEPTDMECPVCGHSGLIAWWETG